MRVVLDTNVLVSGTFWKGDSEKIVDKVENKEVELISSKELIEEYEEVINREEIMDKTQNKDLILNESVQKVINDSTIVEPTKKFDVVKEDPKDNKIVECAVEGNADYIISQDNHLLNLKEFNGIKILTPEEFLGVLYTPK